MKTSTPLLGREWLLRPEEKGEKEKVKDGEKGGKKKKKSSKNRRHERKLKARLGKSTDSLYSSVGGEGENGNDTDESSNSSSDDESVDVCKGLVIREVPRIGKFALYGSEDIVDFSRSMKVIVRER